MKPRILHVVTFFFIVSVLVMCGGDDDDRAPSSNNSYILSEKELAENKLAAVRGSGYAAYILTLHYAFGRGDESNGMIWYIIGAENGSLGSQYTLYLILCNRGNDSHTRGIFWLYKLAVLNLTASNELFEPEKDLEREGYTLETACPPSDTLFPFNYASLSTQQLEQCKEGALKGSGKAALIMAQYFGLVAKDADLAEYWYQIGSQNGNAECQYQFGNILLGKEDELDRERGQFWQTRALENGYE